MFEIPIVTVRKSSYAPWEVHTLKGHSWFLFECPGTLSFRPDMPLSDKRAKRILKEYLEAKRNLPVHARF
jgi:hypothetical protein